MERFGEENTDCFWLTWLFFLRALAQNSVVNAAGEKSNNEAIIQDNRVTLDDIFVTTKALLAQGANFTFEMEPLTSPYFEFSLKRHGPDYHELDFEITSSAMFWLEECFNGYPEFHEFTAAIKPLVKRPWRRIISITKTQVTEDTEYQIRAYPDGEEMEMLWLLIERWEETGHPDDLDALWSAMRRVFRAQNPDIILGVESDEDIFSEESDKE